MRNSRAAKRYAKALLDLSIEKNVLEECFQDMRIVRSVCLKSREFSRFLKSPIIKTDKKRSIIDEVFSKKISRITFMFINIIITKKRESLLQEISESFIFLYKIYKNIESATVITAVPLEKDLKEEVIKFIKLKTKSKVELKEVVNEDIGGGIIVRMRDKQLDASVSRAIKELKQEFNKNLYIKDF